MTSLEVDFDLIYVYVETCIKIVVSRGLEAEKPCNLAGFQDLCIEITVSQAWRLRMYVCTYVYMDVGTYEKLKKPKMRNPRNPRNLSLEAENLVN